VFLLCFHLFIKGNVELKVMENSDEESHVKAFNSPSIENTDEVRRWSCLFKFYNGLQRHPLLCDVNLKQLVNSRISMMLWQITIMNFGFYSYVMRLPYEDLINYGLFVNVTLQTVYICKFFYWERGYYSTLDIVYDRAGFYICWGCLVFLPFLYTFSTYYFVSNKPTISAGLSVCFLLLGLISITLNYVVDRQKQEFRKKKDAYKIWGKKAEYIDVYYNKNGITHNSTLLISGFWGIARHMNYTFEILLALFWCMPGYNLSVFPFMYLIVLTVLLVHRVFRDEKRCHQKYSNQWLSYCKIVKWRMIPYVF